MAAAGRRFSSFANRTTRPSPSDSTTAVPSRQRAAASRTPRRSARRRAPARSTDDEGLSSIDRKRRRRVSQRWWQTRWGLLASYVNLKRISTMKGESDWTTPVHGRLLRDCPSLSRRIGTLLGTEGQMGTVPLPVPTESERTMVRQPFRTSRNRSHNYRCRSFAPNPIASPKTCLSSLLGTRPGGHVTRYRVKKSN